MNNSMNKIKERCEKCGMEFTSSRLYTNNLLRLVDMDYLDAKSLLGTVLMYFSEDDIEKLATDPSICDDTAMLPMVFDRDDSDNNVDYWLSKNGKIGG